MSDLKSKRLAVLESTLNYFTISNRSVVRTMNRRTCQYAPIEGVSEGCAVGRLIKDKDLCKRLDDNGKDGMSATVVVDVWEQLPKSVQELGLQFLSELQILHDSDIFWCNEGLNKEGQKALARIKRNHIENLVD